MKRQNIIILIMVFALSSMPSLAIAELKMGILPRRSPLITRKAFMPLAEILSKKLGERVDLIISKDFQIFWKRVENNEFDLIHCTQYHYIKARKMFGYKVFVANVEAGSRTLAGALLVRNDSGIEKVSDLKGKTIMLGGDKYAVGTFLGPTTILMDYGLVAHRDYTLKRAKSGPNAVLATYRGLTDACGAGDIIFKLRTVALRNIDMSQMKILAKTESFVNLAWAAKMDMPEDKVEKVQAVMCALKNDFAGKGVLKAAGVTDFLKATDADFDRFREIVKIYFGDEY